MRPFFATGYAVVKKKLISLVSFFIVSLSSISANETFMNTQPTSSVQKHNRFTIPLGVYRHYKGDLYEVIGIGRHTETNEELVFYKAKYYSPEFGNGALWARPLSMFIEIIEFEGKTVPRFQHLQ